MLRLEQVPAGARPGADGLEQRAQRHAVRPRRRQVRDAQRRQRVRRPVEDLRPLLLLCVGRGEWFEVFERCVRCVRRVNPFCALLRLLLCGERRVG